MRVRYTKNQRYVNIFIFIMIIAIITVQLCFINFLLIGKSKTKSYSNIFKHKSPETQEISSKEKAEDGSKQQITSMDLKDDINFLDFPKITQKVDEISFMYDDVTEKQTNIELPTYNNDDKGIEFLVTDTYSNIDESETEFLANWNNENSGSHATIEKLTAREEKYAKLRKIMRCGDKTQETKIEQHGDYWVLLNWIPAKHGSIRCHETITITTHADYTFVHNVRAVAASWQAPISMTIFAPGADFDLAMEKIHHIRHCDTSTRQWVSFHLFFHRSHIPANIYKNFNAPNNNYNCSYEEIEKKSDPYMLYKFQKKIPYPVNVARNIARNAALTHLVFSLDIELNPNPGLVQDILQLLVENPRELNRNKSWVFVLPEFEVAETEKIPMNKTELLRLISEKKAVPMHKFVCAQCHAIDLDILWLKQAQTEKLKILGIGKRVGKKKAWEIIHIGKRDSLPSFEERVFWEGTRDKMVQSYLLCVQDYDLLILNNAFVTHTPGIKRRRKLYDKDRIRQIFKTSVFINRNLTREYNSLYGVREGCVL